MYISTISLISEMFVFQLTFNLMKCRSKEDPKTCEKFFKFDIDDVCKKLPQENQIWSNFVKQMNMEKNCPIHPVSR